MGKVNQDGRFILERKTQVNFLYLAALTTKGTILTLYFTKSINLS